MPGSERSPNFDKSKLPGVRKPESSAAVPETAKKVDPEVERLVGMVKAYTIEQGSDRGRTFKVLGSGNLYEAVYGLGKVKSEGGENSFGGDSYGATEGRNTHLQVVPLNTEGVKEKELIGAVGKSDVAVCVSYPGKESDNRGDQRSGRWTTVLAMNPVDAEQFLKQAQEKPEIVYRVITNLNKGPLQGIELQKGEKIEIFPNTQYGGAIAQRLESVPFEKAKQVPETRKAAPVVSETPVKPVETPQPMRNMEEKYGPPVAEEAVTTPMEDNKAKPDKKVEPVVTPATDVSKTETSLRSSLGELRQNAPNVSLEVFRKIAKANKYSDEEIDGFLGKSVKKEKPSGVAKDTADAMVKVVPVVAEVARGVVAGLAGAAIEDATDADEEGGKRRSAVPPPEETRPPEPPRSGEEEKKKEASWSGRPWGEISRELNLRIKQGKGATDSEVANLLLEAGRLVDAASKDGYLAPLLTVKADIDRISVVNPTNGDQVKDSWGEVKQVVSMIDASDFHRRGLIESGLGKLGERYNGLFDAIQNAMSRECDRRELQANGVFTPQEMAEQAKQQRLVELSGVDGLIPANLMNLGRLLENVTKDERDARLLKLQKTMQPVRGTGVEGEQMERLKTRKDWISEIRHDIEVWRESPGALVYQTKTFEKEMREGKLKSLLESEKPEERELGELLIREVGVVEWTHKLEYAVTMNWKTNKQMEGILQAMANLGVGYGPGYFMDFKDLAKTDVPVYLREVLGGATEMSMSQSIDRSMQIMDGFVSEWSDEQGKVVNKINMEYAKKNFGGDRKRQETEIGEVTNNAFTALVGGEMDNRVRNDCIRKWELGDGIKQIEKLEKKYTQMLGLGDTGKISGGLVIKMLEKMPEDLRGYVAHAAVDVTGARAIEEKASNDEDIRLSEFLGKKNIFGERTYQLQQEYFQWAVGALAGSRYGESLAMGIMQSTFETAKMNKTGESMSYGYTAASGLMNPGVKEMVDLLKGAPLGSKHVYGRYPQELGSFLDEQKLGGDASVPDRMRKGEKFTDLDWYMFYASPEGGYLAINLLRALAVESARTEGVFNDFDKFSRESLTALVKPFNTCFGDFREKKGVSVMQRRENWAGQYVKKKFLGGCALVNKNELAKDEEWSPWMTFALSVAMEHNPIGGKLPEELWSPLGVEPERAPPNARWSPLYPRGTTSSTGAVTESRVLNPKSLPSFLENCRAAGMLTESEARLVVALCMETKASNFPGAGMAKVEWKG